MSRHPKPQPLGGRPSVTVVIPCFNYGHFLPVAVGSVLGQERVDVEIIAIDDASTDGSDTVLRDLAATDERIRAIFHAANRGHIATYNEGLEQARGAYVLLLSADDALTPGSLARSAALLEAEPSVGLVYGFPVTFLDELPKAEQRVRSWTVWKGNEWIEVICRKGANPIHNPEVLLRTSVQHAIGGYVPELPHSGDLEMWLRAAAIADVGRVNGPTQAYYRIHQSSMQRTQFAGHMTDLDGLLATFARVLVGPEAQVHRGEGLFATARRSLAYTALRYARLAFDYGRSEFEPVDDYIAFAERVWPPVRGSRSWRAVRRRGGERSERLQNDMAASGRRAVENITQRLRWRRWRWSGV